jgi:hypothetical protein
MTNPTINANDLTYGIEIETTIPNDAPVRVGGYHSGAPVATAQIPHFNGRAWRADQDGSIGCDIGRRGAEFVSPVLSGAAGLDNVAQACAFLKSIGAKVNDTCGLHIHVGLPTNDLRVIQRLVRIVGQFEQALFASTGTRTRERSRYCQSIKTRRNIECNWSSKRTLGDVQYGRDNDHACRYRTLNLTNLLSGRMPTVEFRVFSPSMNPTKIAAWVQMCLAMVQMAMTETRVKDWNAQLTEKYGGDGNGERAVNHLFYRLGWTKGECRVSGYGDVGSSIYTVERSKSEIRRLARRYDGNYAA